MISNLSYKEEIRKPEIGLKSDFLDYYDHCFRASLFAEKHYERFATRGLFRWCVFHILESFGIPVPLHGPVRDFPNILRSYFSSLVKDLEFDDREKALKLLAGEDTKLVVYKDPLAHRGEGKELMPLGEALECYQDCYASLYLSHYFLAISVRYLVIGNDYHAVIVYRNRKPEEWRSNYGNVDVHLIYLSVQTEEEKLKFYTELHDTPDAEVLAEGRAFLTVVFRKNLRKKIWPLQRRLNAPLLAVDFLFGGWGSFGGYFAINLDTAPQLSGTGVEKVLSPETIVREIENFFKHYRGR